jgi:hypothetical protein
MMSKPSSSTCGIPATGSTLALVQVDPVLQADRVGGASALGWPYVAVRSTDDYPLARRLIGMSGLVLGASAGLFVGGMAATLLAALLHPFLPRFARLVLLSLTLFSLAVGAIVGRRVLQRETFE